MYNIIEWIILKSVICLPFKIYLHMVTWCHGILIFTESLNIVFSKKIDQFLHICLQSQASDSSRSAGFLITWYGLINVYNFLINPVIHVKYPHHFSQIRIVLHIRYNNDDNDRVSSRYSATSVWRCETLTTTTKTTSAKNMRKFYISFQFIWWLMLLLLLLYLLL